MMGHLETLRKWLIYCLMVPIGLFFLLLAILFSAFKHGPLCLFRGKKQYLQRPSCMDDPQLGTHGHVNTEFGDIHYVASGPRDKPLMLFVHGFPENWYSWRYQITEFQKEYRVIAIDTRGAGESQKSSVRSNFTIDKLALDLKAVLTALGYSSCVLVAHDWGGVIAWHFAGTYPDLVDKLIILNAPELSQLKQMAVGNFTQTWKSWYIFAFQWPWIPEYMFALNHFGGMGPGMYGKDNKRTTKEDIEAVKYGLSQPGTLTSVINYYRANIGLLSKQRKRNSILCPTNLIWGTADGALDISMTKGHDKYVQDLTVTLIEGANHFVHAHKPDEVNEAMRRFLQGDGNEEVVNIIS